MTVPSHCIAVLVSLGPSGKSPFEEDQFLRWCGAARHGHAFGSDGRGGEFQTLTCEGGNVATGLDHGGGRTSAIEELIPCGLGDIIILLTATLDYYMI